MGEPVVVDLSSYQPDVDFVKMQDSGVLGVILKATEGSTLADSSFIKHWNEAEAVGLAVSSYHYLHHGNIAAQMSFYLSVIEPRVGERVCIDYEDGNCTLDDLHQAVNYLLDANLNLQIAVYSGHLLKDQLGDSYDDLLANNTSLWLAQYTSGSPSWPTGTYPVWSLWQYTDKAKVDGYDGQVDGNRFNGSDDQLLKWFGPASGDQPSASVPTVAITLDADSDVNISVRGGNNVTIL